MSFGPYEIVDCTTEYSLDTTFCPVCRVASNIQSSQKQALSTGLSFAHCGDVIFQVVRCHEPGCTGRFMFRCKADSPALDMQDLILMPCKMDFVEYHEESIQINPPPDWVSYLQFKRSKIDQSYICVQIDEPTFRKTLEKELSSGKIHLRRLCHDNKFYNALFSLIPALHTDFGDNLYNVVFEHIKKEGMENITNAIKLLMKYNSKKFIHEQITKKLVIIGYNKKSHTINKQINQVLNENTPLVIGQLYQLFLEPQLNYEQQVALIFNKLFDKIFFSVCSDFYLAPKREKLSQWINKVKKGNALFIDAPMGLGKTYSITEVLASKQNLSAIIFLPTRRLCDEFCINLTNKIAEINHDPPKMENGVNTDIVLQLDENGQLHRKGTQDYLNRNGVYYFDGINKQECPFFDDIIQRYNRHVFSKKDFCYDCGDEPTCRFSQHKLKAPLYRIIITTHARYDHLFNHFSSFKWKRGKTNRARDLFIIDEDIVFTKCYTPVCMGWDELKEFIATATNFLNDQDYFKYPPVNKDIFLKIDSILAQYVKCDTTSYIPPIDYDFSFSEYIKGKWHEHFDEIDDSMPDLVNASNHTGNYLDLIEAAIQKGFMVQKYNLFNNADSVKNIYFTNPKVYQFKKNTPAHVFFDGTMLDEKLITNKLQDVQFNKYEIPINDPLWEVKAWQNINTDLPKSKAYQNENTVKNLLSEMLPELGLDNKYFILTSKTLRELIEQWVKNAFSNTEIIFEHYGNLRGVNTAKECNIGIVLGSHVLSDAVEIAMSLDFICEKFKSHNPVPITTQNNLWTWQINKGSRKYKKSYKIIENLSKKYRYAEYRQALARTRYLFHPVSFYVFSKDKIIDYEPFINKVETEQYKSDMFPQVQKHPNNIDSKIEEKVNEWLQNHLSVSATDIYKEYGIRRQTVGKYLKERYAKGKILKMEGTKKRYRGVIM